MSKPDLEELNEILRESIDRQNKTTSRGDNIFEPGDVVFSDIDKKQIIGSLCQWTTSDNKRFVPSSKTADRLIPGVYDIYSHPEIGVYFEQIPVLTTGLIRFPETNSDKVVEEIQKFWGKEEIFKSYNLTYKRGIILWGPAGSGKTSVIQIIMRDVVDRGGVVIKFTHPGLFLEGIRKFREIQPTTPVVVLMEDLDSILEVYSESEVLNILDGVNQVQKIVFLATTNYPEKLGARIINRPSRFDKRFKIGYPNKESRRLYLSQIIGKEKLKTLKIDLEKWIEDTEGFSVAHLKELFTAVVILGDDYNDAVELLTTMKEEKPDSLDDEKPRKAVGFISSKPKRNHQ